MGLVIVPSVGTGLSMSVRHGGWTYRYPWYETLHVDCGSQENVALAWCHGPLASGARHLMISHLHWDHYNGLPFGLFSSTPYFGEKCLDLDHFYYPIIPEFPERDEYAVSLLTMDRWIAGRTSGDMNLDLLTIVDRLNRNSDSFQHRPVAQGETIDVGGSVLKVLWPPRRLDDSRTRGRIGKALTKFKDALEQNPDLKFIHERVNESGIVTRYVNAESQEVPEYSNELLIEPLPDTLRPRNIAPASIRDANRALRQVANSLSIAFQMDDRLLFMGDLEAQEIKTVIDSIANPRRWNVLIAPHHGTHWEKSLHSVETELSIASVGKRLRRFVRPDYQQISRQFKVTHDDGEVVEHT